MLPGFFQQSISAHWMSHGSEDNLIKPQGYESFEF